MITNVQLFTDIAALPDHLKEELAKFVEYLKYKSPHAPKKNKKRVAGLAKGLIEMNDNFDEPIDAFKPYMK